MYNFDDLGLASDSSDFGFPNNSVAMVSIPDSADILILLKDNLLVLSAPAGNMSTTGSGVKSYPLIFTVNSTFHATSATISPDLTELLLCDSKVISRPHKM